MSDSPTTSDQGSGAPDALLRELDPVLNIFALANGLDLVKDASGQPERLLGWYRDGMERFLRVAPDADETGHFVIWAEAVQTREGTVRRGRRQVRGGLGPESLRKELRALLEQGIERANGLGLGDLEAGQGGGT